MPGARGTRLFRKVGAPDTLLAIAEWDSKEAREEAMATLEKSDEETKRLWRRHREYGEFTKIGAYEETDWEVLPKALNLQKSSKHKRVK